MKIAVCVKEVVDARLPLHVERSGRIVQQGSEEPDPVSLINPADRAALEVAMRLREERSGRVTALSVCDEGGQSALHFSLARGCDHAERLCGGEDERGPPRTARLLASRLASEGLDLVCCGDETLDNSSAMVGPLLAELLELPQVTAVGRVREAGPDRLVLERRLERGYREVVEVGLPALVAFTTEAADPGYVSLRRQQRARRLPIPVWNRDREGGGGLPSWPEGEEAKAPRARVKKKFAPDSNLPPEQRVGMVMGGGPSQQASSDGATILDGDAEYLSEQLFRFLKHHEFV